LFTVCNSYTSVSSLPSEPAKLSPGPHTKGDDEIRQMAEAIMDKVVDQLLNEAAEVVLRED
jgi:DNA topoisomerase VI subunit B